MKIQSLVKPHAGAINAIVEHTGIDAGAYRVLLNMLAQNHYVNEQLARVYLGIKGEEPRKVVGLDSILYRRCAPHADSPPFVLYIPQPLEENEQPVIRIEFARNLSQTEFDFVAGSLQIWDDIIASGGFADTFDRIDLMEPSGECYMLSPNTVEHPCDGSPDQPVAYDALINMAIKVNATYCPIVVLEID